LSFTGYTTLLKTDTRYKTNKMAYGVTFFLDDDYGHRSPTAHAQRHRFGRCNRTLSGRQYTRGGAEIEIMCTNTSPRERRPTRNEH
jgi:hypothetical protein